MNMNTGSASNIDTQREIKRQSVGALTLGAIGVVYGDIGTSPLYTVKEIFSPATGVRLSPENLIGAVSTILWALMLVVTLKYVILILRADNRGEGGALALAARAADAVKNRPRLRRMLLLFGAFGATLFYGDSLITPAISVVGAMEGLEILTPALKPYIIPFSLVLLVGLFLVQRRGTHSVGKLFGPVIVLWFLVLGLVGVIEIIKQPAILAAINPIHAVSFLLARGPLVLLTVGAIVLAVTGAEALYADMGHFGRKPIQLAWLFVVFPGLALNYMGQGALLMRDPSALENPFYKMFPSSWLIPALILSTLAAIIASQAVISGAYSMTKQAILLGFFPRMKITYTSEQEVGQIYVPAVNWALLVGVLIVVLAFKSSSALAGAYGIAVTLTMAITTTLTYFVVRDAWKLPLPIALFSTAFFLCVDLFLFAGCIIKFFDGGWFPLALAVVLFMFMSTWATGRKLVLGSIQRDGLELEPFIENLHIDPARIAERTAVYPVASSKTVPHALLHNLKHNQVLHECNVILTVQFQDAPWVAEEQQLEVTKIGRRFWKVIVRLGFMNQPDVPKALERCEAFGLSIPMFETTYFLSRESVVPTPGEGMALWREKLFASMSRNSGDVAEFFQLPDNAVVELGTRVQI